MKKSAGRKKWFVAVGVVLAGTFAFFLVKGRGKRELKYVSTPVTRGGVKSTILSTGVVAPENRLDLKAPVAGRIEKVLVQEGQVVSSGQILAWMSSTERAALIDTARSKGAAEMQYWQDSYKMTPILAPKPGLVILKSVDAGQTVTQTDNILSMSDRLIVKANVDETDLAEVKNGQRALLVLDAFRNFPLEAHVVHIGYDAKTVNNVTTYEVDVLAEKTPPFMKSGMTVNVTFLISEKENVLLVPASAIRRENKRSTVLVPNPEPRGEAIPREVEVGISDGKKVEILTGLSDGDTVLTPSLRSLSTPKEERASSAFNALGGGGPRPPR